MAGRSWARPGTSFAIRAYATKIQAIVEKTVQRWAVQDSIVFYDEVKRLLLDIAFEVFCWVDDSESQVPKISQAFTDMMEGALGIVRFDTPGFLYHRGLEGRRYLKQFFMDLIDKKRASDDEDAFAHFCREKTEDGEYYEDEDIADHMVFLMLAAHDTTTSAATMAAYYLCNDYPLQSKLAAQVQQWPRDLDFETVFHSINGMIAVFYETVRMHPPVPLFLRRSIRDCEIGGVHVPADTMICIPGTYIHRLKDWWQDPNTFDPTRFSEEVSEPPQAQLHVGSFRWWRASSKQSVDEWRSGGSTENHQQAEQQNRDDDRGQPPLLVGFQETDELRDEPGLLAGSSSQELVVFVGVVAV